MIGCLRTWVHKQPIIALYFESENVLKFYNLEARRRVSSWIGPYGVTKRESNMRAPDLFNLLNCLRKSNKMQDILSILSHFPCKFNKFSRTGAEMLDSIYDMTL